MIRVSGNRACRACCVCVGGPTRLIRLQHLQQVTGWQIMQCKLVRHTFRWISLISSPHPVGVGSFPSSRGARCSPEPPPPGRVLAELEAGPADEHGIGARGLREEEAQQRLGRLVDRGVAGGEVDKLQEGAAPVRESVDEV